MGVQRAAEFGAEKRKTAGRGRPEPHRLERAGDDIVLQPEGRDEEAVDDVLRSQDKAHSLADRHMQRIDLPLSAGVLNFPHPLLADDIEFEIG